MATEEKIIKQFEPIPLGENTQVQVKLKEFKEKEYLDIRVWWKPENEEKYLPTGKGISFPLSDTLDSVDSLVKTLVYAYCILHDEKEYSLIIEEK